MHVEICVSLDHYCVLLQFQAHPWFRSVQWDKLYEMEAAYKPTVNGELDTQNFEKFPEVSTLCIEHSNDLLFILFD